MLIMERTFLRIIIRTLRVTDIPALHKMYNSFSSITKRFFHPGFLGVENINLNWFFVQMALTLSTTSILKKLLLGICPYAVFLPLVAVNEQNNVVAFAFLKVKRRLLCNGFSAMLGIGVRDKYQGKGLGSMLIEAIIDVARREGIQKISSSVLTDNVVAVRLYEKYGFKKVRLIKNGDAWRGHKYDSIEMWLDVSNSGS